MTMISLDVLAFDRVDRMRKSLRIADLSGAEIAEYLGVRAETVSTWLNGKHAPSKTALMAWSRRTGVPFEWLADGKVPSSDEDGTDVRPEGFEPPAY